MAWSKLSDIDHSILKNWNMDWCCHHFFRSSRKHLSSGVSMIRLSATRLQWLVLTVEISIYVVIDFRVKEVHASLGYLDRIIIWETRVDGQTIRCLFPPFSIWKILNFNLLTFSAFHFSTRGELIQLFGYSPSTNST